MKITKLGPMIAAVCAAVIFFTAVNAQALHVPSEISGRHEIYCKEDNTKRGILDEYGFESCIKRQRKAYFDLTKIADNYKDKDWAQAAVDWALAAHTERGNRDDWAAWASLKSITEGFEDIVYQMRQARFNKSKYELCRGRWDFHFEMVTFCYKNDNPDWVP